MIARGLAESPGPFVRRARPCILSLPRGMFSSRSRPIFVFAEESPMNSPWRSRLHHGFALKGSSPEVT